MAVNLLRLLPQQPVRSIDVLQSQVRDVLAHLVDQLVGDNAVAQSPDEQDRTLDVETAFDAQKGLVGLVVGRTIAVIVACEWIVSLGYDGAEESSMSAGSVSYMVRPVRSSSTPQHSSPIRPR